ncbi:MAG: acylphosphatase [Candidatus Bathyarchaeia archaeon]
MIRAHLLIYGRVQGVGFRSSTRRRANQLGLKGWVRNLSNGSVEVVAEGEENAVEKLITWCNRGPSLANVRRVEVERSEAKGEFSRFRVKRSSIW